VVVERSTSSAAKSFGLLSSVPTSGLSTYPIDSPIQTNTFDGKFQRRIVSGLTAGAVK
jgi:hypothetical protein